MATEPVKWKRNQAYGRAWYESIGWQAIIARQDSGFRAAWETPAFYGNSRFSTLKEAKAFIELLIASGYVEKE